MATDMGTATVKNRRNKKNFDHGVIAAAVVAAAQLYSQSAVADRELRIEPTISLRSEFHNRTGAREYPDFIAEINPALSVRYRISDTSASFSYSPRLIFSDLSDQRSSIVHALVGQANTQIASGRISLGTNASVSEQNRDPLVGTTPGDLPARDRIRTFGGGVNAALRENIAPGMFGEIKSGYAFSSSRVVGDTLLTNKTSDTSRYSVSGEIKPSVRRPDFGVLTGAEYGMRTSSDLPNLSSYKGYVGALWNPSSQIGGELRAGFEQNEYVTDADRRRGAYGEVTGTWRPSPLADLRADAGYHYYGFSGGLTGRLRGARSSLEISAARQLVNAQQSIFFPQSDAPLTLLDRFLTATITDPIERSLEVQRLAAVFGLPNQIQSARNFYVDRFFLETSIRAAAVYTLPRYAFNGGASYRKASPSESEITSLSAGNVRPTRDYGGNVGVAYRVTNNGSIRFDNLYTNVRTLDTGEKAGRFRSQLTYTQLWSRAISSGITVFYEQQRSANVLNDYSDRGLAAFVKYSFN